MPGGASDPGSAGRFLIGGPRDRPRAAQSPLYVKLAEPAMTHFVMPFRQNRATSASFFTGVTSAPLLGVFNTVIRQWLFSREKPSEISDGRKTALNQVPVQQY
jgi:hypothetical protein